MNWIPLLALVALFFLNIGLAIGSVGSARVAFTLGSVASGCAALLHVIGRA